MGFDFLTCNMCFKKKMSCAFLLAWTQAHFALKTGFCQGQSFVSMYKRNIRNFSFLELASHDLFCSMGNSTSCAFMNHLCFCC